MKVTVLGAFLLFIPIFGFSATYVFVEPNSLFGEAFKPKVLLYKIQDIANGMQNPAIGPDTVEVSAQELKRAREFLAKGDKQPGSLNKKIKLLDGSTVTAGEYFIMEYLSYKYLNESKEDNRNYLIETFQQAEAIGKNLKGPLWDTMIKMLNDPDQAELFGIVSSWGYSRKEWSNFFEYLKSKGYIQYLPDESHLYSLRRVDFYSFGDNVQERKVNLLFRLSQNLKNVVTPQGEEIALVYADANQEDIASVYKKLHFVAKGKFNLVQGSKRAVELLLVNGGTQEEIKSSNLPQIYKVTQGGPEKLKTQELGRVYPVLKNISAKLEDTHNEAELMVCEELFQ